MIRLLLICVLFSSYLSYSQINEIQFETLDVVPVFPDCTGDNYSLKVCFNKSIRKHIDRKFTVENLNLNSGKTRFRLKFVINENGIIEKVKAIPSNSSVDKEASRVFKLLPRMKSGKHKGNNVSINYSIPITFTVPESNAQKTLRERAEKKVLEREKIQRKREKYQRK